MGVKQRASRLLNHPWKELSQFQKSYVKNKIIKIGNLKIPVLMVQQFNNEWYLHNFCLMDFKSSSGMLSSSNNDIQKKKIQNLIHSLSSIGPSVSMEMPLAKDYLGVSNIMEWFNSFLVSKNQLASTRSIG